MPYINHKGVQIHYEVQGQGEPLLLQHGLTQNAQVWHQSGWVAQHLLNPASQQFPSSWHRPLKRITKSSL